MVITPRFQDSFSFDILSGFFSSTDISSGLSDDYSIDLSGITIPTDANYYLEIKTINQALDSPFIMDVEVTKNAATTYSFPENQNVYGININSESNANLDTVGRVLLSTGASSDNNFTFKLTPTDYDSFIITNSGVYVENEFFPSLNSIRNDEYPYLLIVRVVKQVGSSYELAFSRNIPNTGDNTYCADAEDTYGVTASNYVNNASKPNANGKGKSKSSDSVFACGRIIDINGNPPGPGNMLTFLLGIFFIASSGKIRKGILILKYQ